MANIISFDSMKLQKDVLGNQPSKTLVQNVINLAKASFPGVTHFALSVPTNTNAEMQAHGTNPSPLSIEDFTKLWIDTIHNAGYGVLFRGTPSEFEGIWNFPLEKHPGTYWVGSGIDFLNRFKGSLKNGDIFGIYPEFGSILFGQQFQCVDDGTGDANKDINNFLINMSQAVTFWSAANGIAIIPYITVNRSEVPNGYVWESVWAKMNAVVYDYYGDSKTIEEMFGKIDEVFNKFNGKYKVFQQEWGDTRSSIVVANDPEYTARMADMVFFPKFKEGKLLGINFWNFFDTPQEGIITINGDTVSLNAKGQALATIFKKWFGSTIPSTQTIEFGPRVKKGTVWYRDLKINGVVADKLRSYNI